MSKILVLVPCVLLFLGSGSSGVCLGDNDEEIPPAGAMDSFFHCVPLERGKNKPSPKDPPPGKASLFRSDPIQCNAMQCFGRTIHPNPCTRSVSCSAKAVRSALPNKTECYAIGSAPPSSEPNANE
mmetsp:Transcript_18157/g.50561  ORF Transcript_18157/g.50561 Transcript_18157/m.50561 type:complete len:126 (+) Transcript_18157:124-501(+)